MANPSPKQSNLVRQKPSWKHLPTKAVRIPEVFEQQVIELARSLDTSALLPFDKLKATPSTSSGQRSDHQGTTDSGNNHSLQINLETTIGQLDTWTLEDLLKLQLELPLIIDRLKDAQCDRRLEQAILYLAGRCDGANSEDGQGFNKLDTGFGRWLANRIESKQPLISVHAEAALKMLAKYSKQLERGGISLPAWEAIAHQYPREQKMLPPSGEEELSERRIEIKNNKIAVYAPYDASGKFQRSCKEIEGYKFNSDDKGWYFPLFQLEEVLAAFPALEYEYDPNIEGALALLNQQREEERAAKEAQALEASEGIIQLVEAAEIDAPLANGWHLRDYQKQGVEWLLAHRKDGIYRGGILADHMGLGKSVVSLVAARAMQKIFDCPVFVVAPVSLLENWRREAERAEVRIELFSNSYQKIPSPLENQKYVLIADEAHGYQDEKSKRTERLMALSHHENCLATWLLTGTPIKNGSPINLYPLLMAVDHPMAKDKWEYQRRYCNGHRKYIGSKSVWDASGASHLDELSKKTEDAILRRTKDECLKELPVKTRLYKEASLEPAGEKAYRKELADLVQDYRDRVKRKEVDPDAEALVTLNFLRKVGSKAKVDSAIALAQELLEQGQQVVLFTEFLESANAVYAALGGEILTGETKTEERQAAVDRFQSGESKTFVGTIKAGGVGLTLTAASNVILVDRPWTSSEADQAEDRVHRIGQTNAVFATWLQLGDIDKAIDSLLLSKASRIELILKGKRKTLKGLNSFKDLAKELLAIL